MTYNRYENKYFSSNNIENSQNGDIYIMGNNEYLNIKSPIKLLKSIVLCDNSKVLFSNQNNTLITNDIISYYNMSIKSTAYHFYTKICGVTSYKNDINFYGNFEVSNGAIVGVKNTNFSINYFNLNIDNGTVFVTGTTIIENYSKLRISFNYGNFLSINSSSLKIMLSEINKYSSSSSLIEASMRKSGALNLKNTLSSIYNNERTRLNITNISNKYYTSVSYNKILFHTLIIQTYGQLQINPYLPSVTDERTQNSTVAIIANTILLIKTGKIYGKKVFQNPSNQLSEALADGTYVRTSLFNSDGVNSNGENGGTGGGNVGQGTAAYFNLNYGQAAGM